MNYKPFPDQYWARIKQTIVELKTSGLPLFAAFDADGTLWDSDLGENFFNYQIDNKCVSLPTNPWSHYQEMKKINGDPRSAYAWLAQINQSQPVEQVRKWSQQAFNSIQPIPVFTEQKKLIDLFLENQVHIFIVTASIRWAVEPGALALGLTEKNVIGVETKVQQDIVSSEAVYPITYKEGKVEALLKQTGGVYPFFASGNSTGDTELLKAATHLQMAVSAASRDDKLFQSESELLKIAEMNNWMGHRFI